MNRLTIEEIKEMANDRHNVTRSELAERLLDTMRENEQLRDIVVKAQRLLSVCEFDNEIDLADQDEIDEALSNKDTNNAE